MIKHLSFETYLYEFLAAKQIASEPIKHRLHQHAKDRHERLQMLASFAIEFGQEPRLGLIIGQSITNTSYGIFGHALVNSASLLQAQRFLLKHIWIWQEHPQNAIELQLDEQHLYLNYNHPPLWPQHENFLVDLFFSSNLKRSREILGVELTGCRLDLKRAEPHDAARYEKLLNIPVQFDQAADHLVFPRAIAEAPLNPTSLQHSTAYQRHCEGLLEQMQTASDVTSGLRSGLLARVQLAVVRSGKNRLKEADMAAQLNFSIRTLRRKLAAEATSFRQIQQQIQYHLARSYLGHTQLSVADIASLVGYYDTATFNRAYKQWSGETPPQFRRRVMGVIQSKTKS